MCTALTPGTLTCAGVLAGYALIGTSGCCVSAEGVLCDGLLPATISQLSAAFHDPERPPARLELCGQAATVVRRTACDVYATFPRRCVPYAAPVLSTHPLAACLWFWLPRGGV